MDDDGAHCDGRNRLQRAGSAWSVAQLAWLTGPLALAGFVCVPFYTSTLLANAYRAPQPITGTRNRTYMDAVRSYLSMCRSGPYIIQGYAENSVFLSLCSVLRSLIRRSDCVLQNGEGARCDTPGTMLMLAFTIVQVVVSQFPGLEHITWLQLASTSPSVYPVDGFWRKVDHTQRMALPATYTLECLTIWHRSQQHFCP
ncbi:hypothetical protein ACQ4PT_065960 [Festuca glaucescens]